MPVANRTWQCTYRPLWVTSLDFTMPPGMQLYVMPLPWVKARGRFQVCEWIEIVKEGK